MFVDFGGDTIDIFDPITGEAHAMKLFVVAMGASSCTYAEACPSERLPDWIGVHTNLFSFLGGVPKFVVYDYVPGHVIGLLCPERLCGPQPLDPTVLDDGGHITIRGQRAIREVLVRSARLVFGAVPPKKAPGRPQAPPASS